MHITYLSLAGLLLSLAATTPANAQSIDTDVVLKSLLDKNARSLAGTIAKRALKRGRRAFALGPEIGIAPAITGDGDGDLHIAAGLALVRYDIEILISRDRVMELIKSRAKRILLERVVGRSKPTEADLERLVREVIEDVKAELLLELRPRRFERPKMKLTVEGARLREADAWQLRGAFGIGVSRVFVSSGLVLQVNGGADLVVPLELSVPMLLTRGLRSPSVEFFGRVDFAVTDRDNQTDVYLLGARLMLDVI